ncbi:MAG: hypothetical protein AB1746_00325 [Candidatus Zixiibacteriota bacterium]
MKTTNDEKSLLTAACNNLERNAIELIDFDSLARLLMNIEAGHADVEKNARELHLIKDDYRLRILGMLKAMVICKPDENDFETMSVLSESIDAIHAEELIKLYRKTAARFRNRFPASFKYTGISARLASNGNWMEHKI